MADPVMKKPQHIGGYDRDVTNDCEQVLVTLLNGMGPWKDSVFLVGGLAPRYIIEARPPQVPEHAGTGDIDLVVDLAILANTDAYRSLEDNLERLGFTRVAKAKGGGFDNWRWQVVTDRGTNIILEFLACDPNIKGGQIQELPTEGKISAVNIPGADLVFDFHGERKVTVDLLGGNGKATEVLRYADLISFTCLKAFALDHRGEPKDAHDLAYCIEHYPGGTEAVARRFQEAMGSAHAQTIVRALAIVENRFCDSPEAQGYQKDGPVKATKFENPGDDNDPDLREVRALRQRNIADVCMTSLAAIRAT